MTKALIILRDIYPGEKLFFHFYDEIFCQQNTANQLPKSLAKKCNIIDADVISGRDFRACDNKAAKVYKKISQKIFKQTYYKSIDNITGVDSAKQTLDKRIIIDASLHFEIDHVYSNVKNRTKIKNVSVLSKMHSPRVYNYLKNNGLIKYKQAPLNQIINRALVTAKSWLFTIKICSTFEKRFFNSLKSRKATPVKNQFRLALHIQDGNTLEANALPMDFFINESRISPHEILIVTDMPVKREWDLATKKGYEKHSLIQTPHASLTKALRAYINSATKRLKSLRVLITNRDYLNVAFRIIEDSIQWRDLHNSCRIDAVVRFMIDKSPTSSLISQQNNSKTIFIYGSITQQIVPNLGPVDRIDCQDYFGLHYDTVICDSLSAKWFKDLEPKVKNFSTPGPVMTSLITGIQEESVIDYRQKLEISDRPIISFFDNRPGYGGMMTYKELNRFLESMERVLSTFPSAYIIYKSKRDFRVTYDSSDAKVIFDRLCKSSRFRFAMDYELSPFTTMRISDIVVSSPVSSVLLLSSFSGIKTISYDPLERYTEAYLAAEKIPNFSAKSEDQLIHLLRYWFQYSNYDRFVSDEILPILGSTPPASISNQILSTVMQKRSSYESSHSIH